VGLGFGISTLYILGAMRESGGERLIGMDPAQYDSHWRGGGLHNIRRAGYEELYEFRGSTSQEVLAMMAGQRQRIQFAFVDGWHTFDHTLVDFFYIDQMLEPGGIVVFDDVGYPSIRRVCDFILTNRQYEIVDSVRMDGVNRMKRSAKAWLGRLLDPLVRTDKTPSLQAKVTESMIADVYFVGLRKVGDDSRSFDHFVHF
jgi:predicted O-methyltransferase YrrM